MADDRELKMDQAAGTDERDAEKKNETENQQEQKEKNETANQEEQKEKNETAVNGNSNQASESDIESMKKKATQLLLQGKRNIAICDYQGAVAALAESCHLFTQIYDEQADEMGDPYFYYGKALFELVRNESEVLGDQMQDEDGNNDDDDDDDDDEGDDQENGQDGGSNENKEESIVNAQCVARSSNNEGEDASVEGANKEDADGENATAEENEEVNDLQLSWEYLELAKLIYQRNANKCKDTGIKLSEVYLILGENGLESENYQVAIGDILQALELQQKLLPQEDRRIAETYYHLGIAHSLDENFDEAISCFKSAIAQLQKKITSLEERKKAGDAKTEEEEKDAFYTMDGEIGDIRSIIKDIEEKITDMHDSKNQMKAKMIAEVVSGNCGAGTSSSSSASASNGRSASIPVTDISHLVRKKRKNENEEENSMKRPKTDNGV